MTIIYIHLLYGHKSFGFEESLIIVRFVLIDRALILR